VTFVEVSAICAAVEITVSVLKLRAPGLSLDRMPIFAWYLLVTALMMLVGFPPLILGSVLLKSSAPSTGPSSTSPVAATRCCGRTCSGCSGTPRSPSSSCLPRAWFRPCCR